MERTRIIWLDSLKGWLMLLVILGHAIQSTLTKDCFDNPLWNLIYSFHMPAFMAVSGWLAYRPETTGGGYLRNCKRRVFQLLVPYVLWSILTSIIHGRISIKTATTMILYPDSSFWFLWILFIISCCFIGCQWITNKKRCDELIPISMMCTLLFVIMVLFEVRVFGFQFLSYYFLFYTLGYCIHRFPIFQIKNRLLLITLFLLWFILAWYWNMHALPYWMPEVPIIPSSLLQYAYRGLTALIVVVFIFALAPKVLNRGNKVNTLIKSIGEVSLGLYVCHLTIMGDIVKWLRYVLPGLNNTTIIIFAFIIGCAISLSIVHLLKKNEFSSKFLLGKV